MQYLLLIYSEEGGWERMPAAEQEQAMAAYGAFTEALKAAGALKGSNRLQPSTTATTVRVANGKSQVLDGPFIDSKEQLGGYYLVEARDLNEAIQVASRIPGARFGCVEVRPVLEMAP